MSEVAAAEPQIVSRARLDMIETCGRVAQVLGLARSTGQIYGLLYLSTQPMCLDEIADTLRISKGSSSIGTRQLLSWNAIRQVWVHGNRKDYFEVDPDLLNLLRAAFQEFVKPRVNSSERRIKAFSATLSEDLRQGLITQEEYKIMADRLNRLSQMQRKVGSVLPLAEKLL
jgi:DNA-binding transcriptional regulator GbsR (MarR family)